MRNPGSNCWRLVILALHLIILAATPLSTAESRNPSSTDLPHRYVPTLPRMSIQRDAGQPFLKPLPGVGFWLPTSLESQSQMKVKPRDPAVQHPQHILRLPSRRGLGSSDDSSDSNDSTIPLYKLMGLDDAASKVGKVFGNVLWRIACLFPGFGPVEEPEPGYDLTIPSNGFPPTPNPIPNSASAPASAR